MYLLPASCYAALLSALPQAVFKVVTMRSEAGNTEEKELKWQNLLGATKRLMLSCCVQKVYDRKVCAGINKPSGPIKNFCIHHCLESLGSTLLQSFGLVWSPGGSLASLTSTQSFASEK